jgi:outer membrane biosynthesis protein TonB
MQNERFVVLTGHLSNYPLADLVGILRHQRKSGRLLIEYAKGPATFFFQNGELIDARMNELTGLQAICVALAQPEASFNFNPLIQSSRRSIESSYQRAVAELFGCWDESFAQIEAAAAPQPEVLALPPAPPVIARKRSLFLIGAAIAVAVGLSIVIALIGGLNNNAAAETTVRPAQTQVAPVDGAETEISNEPVTTVIKPNRKEEKRNAPEAKPEVKKRPETVAEAQPVKEPVKEPEPASQSIKVVMQIENGRVLKASIANPKPGMDSYEALALRIARQRRYPATANGGQTVTINVNK